LRFNNDEKCDFRNLDSYKSINYNLNSPYSAQKRTGTQFIFCQNILKSLLSAAFEEQNAFSVLYLLVNGIDDLLDRLQEAGQKSDSSIISIKSHPGNAFWQHLEIKEESLVYSHWQLDETKFTNLLDMPPPPLTYNSFFKNTTAISLKDIKTLIEQQLFRIPYNLLVRCYIPTLLNMSCELDSNLKKIARNLPRAISEEKRQEIINNMQNRQKEVIRFFNTMKESFHDDTLKRTILKKERQELFRDFKQFPEPVETIIYEYTDSSTLCFFERREAKVRPPGSLRVRPAVPRTQPSFLD
jgi:hypothetical protein